MSTTDDVIELTKFLYKIPEAMLLLSLSRSVIYEQIRAGRLRFVKQGRATLVPASAIRDYVALLEQEAEVLYGETA
ncbi:helix-turn-helix domain-containing protein [Lentzea sp. NPDC034063]|uniref:helix-turn-helix domain-containing protein n=1 Tax=unclassified Lentzea TaxID=2643253 RepID=UPI0033FED83E